MVVDVQTSTIIIQYLPFIIDFHAIFFSVLKHAYNYTASNIIREEQKQQLIREIIEDMPVEPDNVSEFVNDVLSEIGLVKGSMMDIEHYYATSCATSVFRDIYKQYVQRMENSRLIDFEDMLVYTWELLPSERIFLQPGSISFNIS